MGNALNYIHESQEKNTNTNHHDLIIKFAKNPDDKNSHYYDRNAVNDVIKYIYRGAKKLPPNHQIFGAVGVGAAGVDGAIEDFYKVKSVYKKENYLQLKHIIISMQKKPNLPTRKIRKKVIKTAMFFSPEYQVYYGVHYDEERQCNFHIHLAINSVNCLNGKQINLKSKMFQRFKKKANRIWSDYQNP